MAEIEIAMAVAIVAAIATPHVLPLQRVAPMLAAAVWLNVLLLRATVALGGAVFILVELPRKGVFDAATQWCLHKAVPLLATHLGVSGHPLAHVALVLPTLALAASLMWLLVGLTRAWMTLRRQLRSALGAGPAGSTVVADEKVLVALTAVGKPRIVLSPAALGSMDAQELRASLAHERGHLRRQHRPLSLLASILSALARPLPATRAAHRELAFQLERDADEYAVRETRDPLALASAICKVAQSHTPVLTGLRGRGRLSSRLDILVDGSPPRSASVTRTAAGTSAMLVALTLAMVVTIPGWLAASAVSGALPAPGIGCPH